MESVSLRIKEVTNYSVLWELPLEDSGVKPKGTKYKCSEPNVEARPKCLPTKQFLTFHLSFFSTKKLHNSDFIRTFAVSKLKGRSEILKYSLQRKPIKIVNKH